jgi:hypothetical protein
VGVEGFQFSADLPKETRCKDNQVEDEKREGYFHDCGTEGEVSEEDERTETEFHKDNSEAVGEQIWVEFGITGIVFGEESHNNEEETDDYHSDVQVKGVFDED